MKKDDVLAELDFSDLLIRKQEAQASVEIAQASYNKLLAGATRQEIAVAQANVEQAEVNYQNAKEELEETRKTEEENLAQAQQNLQDLLMQTDQDMTAAEQAVVLAETNLENTKATYLQMLQNRQDSAIKTAETNLSVVVYALDIIDTMLEDDDMKNALSVKDSGFLIEAKASFNDAQNLLEETKSYLGEYKTAGKNLDEVLEKSLNLLNVTFGILNDFYKVLENSVTTNDFPQSSLDAQKLSVNTQITTVSNSITSLQSLEQSLNDARVAYTTNVNASEESLKQAKANVEDALTAARNQLNIVKVTSEQRINLAESRIEATQEAVKITKAQLNQVKAPAKSQDIALQQAQIRQAEAMLAAAENNIEKSILKAPIDGTITKIEYEVGEMVGTKPVISMLNGNALEIEVDISETDISKVSVNDKAEITLDAFTDDLKFYGTVLEIEPAETVIQDVIYYKVKVSVAFDEEYANQVKPGMTADVTITTEEKEDALIVPSRAIVDKNGHGKFLRILENGVLQEIPVEIGIRGDDGIVEVLSEVEVGTEVVTYVKTK